MEASLFSTQLQSLYSCCIQVRKRRLTPYQDGGLPSFKQLLYTTQIEKADPLSRMEDSLFFIQLPPLYSCHIQVR